MIYFFFGLGLLALLLYGLKNFTQADPKKLAKYLRTSGGIVSLILAAVLALRGGFVMAFLLAAFGSSLLGWRFARFTQRGPRQGPTTGMSEREALEILGLSQGATKQEIVQAHKNRMKENHPDRGGSEELAKKINMAKDYLIELLD